MCHIPDPSKYICIGILYLFSCTSPYDRHSSPLFHPICCYGPLHCTGFIDRLWEADAKDRDIVVSCNPTDREVDICKLSRAPILTPCACLVSMLQEEQ